MSKLTSIIVPSTGLEAPVRFGLNGAIREIPRNVITAVTDEELAVLRDSSTVFEVVGSAAARQDAGGAGPGGSASPEADPLDHDKDGAKGARAKKAAKSKKAAKA